MTARVATCQDLANNDADLKKIGDSVWTLLTGASPTSLILPWFPCPAKLKMVMAGLKLVLILRKYVEARRHAEPTNDAIDVLIAEGETTQDIIKVGPAPGGCCPSSHSTFPRSSLFSFSPASPIP